MKKPVIYRYFKLTFYLITKISTKINIVVKLYKFKSIKTRETYLVCLFTVNFIFMFDKKNPKPIYLKKMYQL